MTLLPAASQGAASYLPLLLPPTDTRVLLPPTGARVLLRATRTALHTCRTRTRRCCPTRAPTWTWRPRCWPSRVRQTGSCLLGHPATHAVACRLDSTDSTAHMHNQPQARANCMRTPTTPAPHPTPPTPPTGLPIPPDMDGLPLPLSEPLMRPVYEALLQPPQQQQQQQQEPPQPPPAVTVAAVATGPWQLREASIMEGWNGDGSDENARYAAHFKSACVACLACGWMRRGIFISVGLFGCGMHVATCCDGGLHRTSDSAVCMVMGMCVNMGLHVRAGRVRVCVSYPRLHVPVFLFAGPHARQPVSRVRLSYKPRAPQPVSVPSRPPRTAQRCACVRTRCSCPTAPSGRPRHGRCLCGLAGRRWCATSTRCGARATGSCTTWRRTPTSSSTGVRGWCFRNCASLQPAGLACTASVLA